MRVLFLTLTFPPETGARAARVFELTKRLAAAGHEVQVLTAIPNYPAGRVFDGYRRKLRVVEVIEGVRVIRTGICASNSPRALPRLASYLSFALSALLLGAWRLGRQDVVVFESPPLPQTPIGLIIGRLTRAKVVMNVADVWPDIALRLGYPIGKLSLAALRLLERMGYRCSDAVSVTTPAAMEQIQRRFPGAAVTVISNGADLETFRPSLRSQAVRSSLGAGPGDFLIGYCGLHGLFHGLEAVVDAASTLRSHPRMKFVMVGGGPTKESLVRRAGERRLSNVRFLDTVPRKDVAAILASCDAGLAPLGAELPGTMPSKVYETLASGVPLVVSKGCEAERLVDEFGVGRTFQPMDSDGLAAALLDLADSPQEVDGMRRRCRELAERFDRETAAAHAERVLLAVAEGRPLPQAGW